MINSINELQKGDLIIYRNGRVNYVNKPFKYQLWYDENFCHREFGIEFDIIEIKRYKNIVDDLEEELNLNLKFKVIGVKRLLNKIQEAKYESK